MKKIFILLATSALVMLTACNEKPAKNQDVQQGEAQPAATAGPTDKAANGKAPVVNVEHAAPTQDGKDHTVAEFNTKDLQVRLENLADGTFRLSTWKLGQDKSSKPEQVVETKQCVMQGGNYLMKDNAGKVYIISNKAGAEQLTIMDNKKIIYNSIKGK